MFKRNSEYASIPTRDSKDRIEYELNSVTYHQGPSKVRERGKFFVAGYTEKTKLCSTWQGGKACVNSRNVRFFKIFNSF